MDGPAELSGGGHAYKWCIANKDSRKRINVVFGGKGGVVGDGLDVGAILHAVVKADLIDGKFARNFFDGRKIQERELEHGIMQFPKTILIFGAT